MSKGLKEPVILTDEEEIEKLEEDLGEVKRVRSTAYMSDYYGTVTYTQVVCAKPVQVERKPKWLFTRLGSLFAPKRGSAPSALVGNRKVIQLQI